MRTGEHLAMVPVEPAPGAQQALEALPELMRSMADALRATHERIAALESEVRRLKPVTPAQATEIGKAIRTRAAEVCAAHRAEGCETAAGNAIRKAVKLTCGVQSMRELPRCDYDIAMRQVAMWDDYQAMKRIRMRHGK